MMKNNSKQRKEERRDRERQSFIEKNQRRFDLQERQALWAWEHQQAYHGAVKQARGSREDLQVCLEMLMAV